MSAIGAVTAGESTEDGFKGGRGRAGLPSKRTKRGKRQARRERLGWGYLAPSLVVIGAVTLFPVAFSVFMSFGQVNVTGSGFEVDGFTLSNYSLILGNKLWRYAVLFTVMFTVVTVIIELVLGTLIALVLQSLSAARGWMVSVLLLPWSLITVISAQLWAYIYDPSYGAADTILRALGLGSPVILGQRTSAVIAMIIADVWKTTPFVSVIVLAGLVMIPEELYEAARVDGANGWQAFWRVTLPLLSPTIGLALLFRILQAFGVFDLPFVLTGGGPQNATTSLAVLGYRVMFNDLKFGPGAAIATTTVALVLIGCLVSLPFFKAQVRGSEEVA